MNLGGRPKIYGRTRGVHPDPCPTCPHESELHKVCSECNGPSHAVCTGLTTSPKNPTQYVPCHCTWIPGQPKGESMEDQELSSLDLATVTPDEAATILRNFAVFMDFVDLKTEPRTEPAEGATDEHS